MEIEFTWDPRKAKRNVAKHGVSFGTAKQVFFDPCLIVVEDCEFGGEIRYQGIGHTAAGPLLVTVFVDRSDEGGRSSGSFPQGRQINMSKQRMPISSRKGIKISPKTLELYKKRDQSPNPDPETPR